VSHNPSTDTDLHLRKNFSRIPSILEIPDLIEIQKNTFERFLQTHVEPEKRENTGLQGVFNWVLRFKLFLDSALLELVGYTLVER
jgi:DNA-directed RNA polymerase subunit beta